jgi:hypothetical protein
MRRVLTALLLALFIPATVVAGPMRLCIGNDGHQMVEFVHGSMHHQNDQLTDVAHEKASQTANLENGPDCVDIGLQATATATFSSIKKQSTDDGGDSPRFSCSKTSSLRAAMLSCVRPAIRVLTP